MLDPNIIKSRLHLMARYSKQDVGFVDLCQLSAQVIDQLQERIARLETAISSHVQDPGTVDLRAILADGAVHGSRPVLQQPV